MALIRSEQYDWNSISVVFGGRVLDGCSGIEVEFGYEHEAIRAKGGKAQAINQKNFDCSGTLKLLQSEVEAIIETYGENYQKEYFDITWNFTPEGDALAIRTHQIKHAKLGKLKMGMNNGDSHMTVDVQFMALEFNMNV